MLHRRRETISEKANTVLGEGDDIHMTESVEENEENSSTIANASCIGTVFSPKASSNISKSTPIITVKKIYSFEDDEDNDGDNQIEEGTNDNNQEATIRQLRKPLVVINNAIRHLKENRRMFPWRMKKSRSVTFIPPPSLTSIREYQEIVEDNDDDDDEEDATQAAESETIMSIRSSRKNIGTGRTMMIRQNAQVFGRPSVAHTKWDVSASLSSSESSSSRSLERQRSVTLLDNASCTSGFSDITEDTSFNRVKNVDSSLFKKQVVFVNPSTANFGETYCINEDEEFESEEADDDNNDYPPKLRRYDFRSLTPETSRLREDTVVSNDDTDDSITPRQRIFSDSDIIFEVHRQERLSEFDREISNSSSSNDSKQYETSSDYFDIAFTGQNKDSISHNRRSLGGELESKNKTDVLGTSSGVTRPRTHSDSFLADTFSNDFNVDTKIWYNTFHEFREHNEPNVSDSSSQFPFDYDDSRDDDFQPRTRTHSDSFIQRRDPFIPQERSELFGSSGSEANSSQKARSRTRSLEEERMNFLKSEFSSIYQSESPMASHARRLSEALLKQRLQPHRAKSESDNSLFAAAVSSGSSDQYSENDTATLSTSDSREAPPLDSRLPSPATMTAANAIIDALRPTVAAVAAAASSSSVASILPPRGSARAQEYYWGGSADDENDGDGFWSSESFDDEDVF